MAYCKKMNLISNEKLIPLLYVTLSLYVEVVTMVEGCDTTKCTTSTNN